MTITRHRICVSIMTLLLTLGAAASSSFAAEESILSFDSRVEIRPDGTQMVYETIRVVSAMKKIRRGIYRDFPLRSAASNNVPFRVLSVLIDGVESSDYTVERSSVNARVIIGNPHSFLYPGEHTFVLNYETGGHVQYYDEHAELGWNVTGDGWDFTIEHATCTITLPEGGSFEEVTGWLGRSDSRESPIEFSRPEPGVAVFTAEKEIVKGEHFTVAVRFPKDLVADYSRGQIFRQIVIVALVLLYFLITWYIWGRDPKPGTVIPLFYPPKAGYYGEGGKRNVRNFMSPAAASYVKNAAFLDTRGFSSLFVSLATNGACTLRQRADEFVVTPQKIEKTDLDRLSEEEQSVYSKLTGVLGGDVGKDFVLSNGNATTIREIHDDVVDILAQRYAPLWAQNIWIQVVGWLVVLPAGLLALNDTVDNPFAVLLPPAILAGVVFFVRKRIAYSYSRSINGIASTKAVYSAALFILYLVLRARFAVPLLVFAAGSFAYQIRSLTVSTVVLIGIATLFGPFMKAPSLACRKLLDKIDGLLMYITVAEKDRLTALNPPEYTPETFDRVLPYAVAFGLEDTWCSHFTTTLAAGASSSDQTSPWHGSSGSRYRMFRHGRRSFTDSLSKAAIPPPSYSGSSGSGGGGSFFGGGGGGGAGRGGGGGGGGGW